MPRKKGQFKISLNQHERFILLSKLEDILAQMEKDYKPIKKNRVAYRDYAYIKSIVFKIQRRCKCCGQIVKGGK